MTTRSKRQTKGVFSSAWQLPVAGRYLYPGRRRWTLLAGLLGCAAAAVWLLASWGLRGRTALSPGPVASAHAGFERQCAACHATPAKKAAANGCRVCHEKVGDAQGVYSLATHAGSRSVQPKPAPPGEMACSSCHPDHRGREAAVTLVPDRICTGCHPFGSFNEGHPEPRFVRERIPDDAHLTFAHRVHVKRVREAKGFADPQLACLTCHEPDARGEGFLPIRFDRHCDDCHLTGGEETPLLPVGDPAGPGAPGVATLETFRREGGPALRWAFFTNPEEFSQAGGQVSKAPLYHEDPWVMENLRRIRLTLYPEPGLAGLLKTSVDHGAAGAGPADLSREAVATLREQAAALRGSSDPAVQEELRNLQGLLATAEARIDKGEAPASGAFVTAAPLNPRLTGEQAAALKQLALDLTEACRRCHVVSDAAILRVQTNQRTLLAAEFSHRAHRLQIPFCVDCHGAIAGLGREKAPEGAPDDARIQNLPALALCRDCHNPRQVSNRCVTCHLFHPGKGRHADLVPYRREPAEGG